MADKVLKTLGPCFLSSLALFSHPLALSTPATGTPFRALVWQRLLPQGSFASAPLPRRKCSASGPPTCLGLLPRLATSCRGCGSQLRWHPRGCPASQQLPRPSKATLPSPVGGCLPASSSDAHPGSPTGLSAPGGQGLGRSRLSLDSWARSTGPAQNRLSLGKPSPRRVGSRSEMT